jgi:hypothetical protein
MDEDMGQFALIMQRKAQGAWRTVLCLAPLVRSNIILNQ